MFVVPETENAIVTRFGKPVRTIEAPGLQFKWPTDRRLRFDNRVLLYDPAPAEFLTQDKKNLVVDTAVVWRIADPARFLETIGNISGAEMRLHDVVWAGLAAALGRTELSQLVSTEPNELRIEEVAAEVRESAGAVSGPQLGVEILEVQLTRLSFPEQNLESVYARMRAERERIAKEYRAQGEEQAMVIRAEADRDRELILGGRLSRRRDSARQGRRRGGRHLRRRLPAGPRSLPFPAHPGVVRVDPRRPDDGHPVGGLRALPTAGWRTRMRLRGLPTAALALALMWLGWGVYFVAPDEEAVVRVLGRARAAPAGPGLHWNWPRPVGRVGKLKVREAKRLTLGFTAPDRVLGGDSAPAEARWLTGDRNVVHIRLVALYAIHDPLAYSLRFENVESVLQASARGALLEVVAGMSVDELLTTGKVAVQQSVQAASQGLFDRFETGATVLSVSLGRREPAEPRARGLQRRGQRARGPGPPDPARPRVTATRSCR